MKHITILQEQLQDDLNKMIGEMELLKQRAERLEDFVLLLSDTIVQMNKVKKLEKELEKEE